MSTPDLVQARLYRECLIDEYGASRRPRPGHCATCRLAVTVAITDSGFTVKAWPTPTTVLGELQALVAGLRTFTALPDALLYRAEDVIRSNDADRRRVLVEHRCGDPPPPMNPVHLVKAIPSTTGNEAPPF
jgi:hypothetical protein